MIENVDNKQLAAMMWSIKVILEPGQVSELRALKVSTSEYPKPHVVSGYFDDAGKMAVAAARLTQHAEGVYLIPNPIDPTLLSRAANRLRNTNGTPLTSDSDVLGRRWLLIDIDPVRPAGMSASDEEHRAALDRAIVVRDALEAEGWPLPILADSGNGAHLLYRIDLPPDDGGLVKGCLEALAFRFDDEQATIDQSVHNPGRIWKLYGTMARKGDNVPDRPHRLSGLIDIPKPLTAVSKDLLESLAFSVPRPASKTADATAPEYRGDNNFDLDQWIDGHGLDVDGPRPWKDGRKWVFRICPWNPDHTNRSAFIVQFDSGAVAAGCHHNGCRDNGWRSLRDTVEPGWRENGQTELAADSPDMSDVSDNKASKGSPADKLVRLAEGAEFFHNSDTSVFIIPSFLDAGTGSD